MSHFEGEISDSATIQIGDEVLKLEMETAVMLPEPGQPITVSLDKTAVLLLEGA